MLLFTKRSCYKDYSYKKTKLQLLASFKFSDRITGPVFELYYLYYDRRVKFQDCSLRRSDTFVWKMKEQFWGISTTKA